MNSEYDDQIDRLQNLRKILAFDGQKSNMAPVRYEIEQLRYI